MGLSESKRKNLEDKAFNKLFKKHKPKWTRLARESHKYTKQNMTEGREPLPDDVAKLLYPMIEVDKDFRKHQYGNKARQTRYISWFTDYVVYETLIGSRRLQA